MEGHTDVVHRPRFSLDGSTIVLASKDITLRLWTASIGDPLNTSEGQTAWFQSVSFSPNGNIIMFSSRKETVRVYHPHASRR